MRTIKFRFSFILLILLVVLLFVVSKVFSPTIQVAVKQTKVTQQINKTGTQDVSDQVHIEFQNDTNSCRSCHEPITTVWSNHFYANGVYPTCTACHDGSLGIYNVFIGNASSGSFGGSYAGNMSIHNVNPALKDKAAPGGNRESVEENWTADFSCGSCHNPHGSYSDRLLTANPNNMGNVTADKGGKRLTGVPVVNTLTGSATSYVLLKTTLMSDPSISYPNASVGPEYVKKGLVKGDVVIQLYKKNGSTYVAEKDPWLTGFDWVSGPTNKLYWTEFYESTDSPPLLHAGMLKEGVILGNGFIAAKANLADTLFPANIAIANISRAYVVKLDVEPIKEPKYSAFHETTTNISTLWTANDGRGKAMSAFCSACHTDYLAKSGSLTGIFSHAYRHTTISDRFTCVRCHYAHGTDVSLMRDANGKTVQEIVSDPTYFPDIKNQPVRAVLARDYMLDRNPSSALKRYTNMSICWGCHHDDKIFVNTSYYEYGSVAVQP